jgi:hypothetical protein
MTIKFGRDYRVTLDPADGEPPIIVTMPFTIRFNMQREIFSALNHLSLDIYNLSEAHRNRIFQDRYVGGPPPKKITLEAGYSTLYRIYEGIILRASSAREETNIVTKIECVAGRVDVATSQTFTTLQSGQTVGSVLKFLMGQFPNLQPGAIGNYPDVITRPVVLNGATWNLLKQYSNDTVYIDNGKIYCLQNNEVLPGSFTINDETGLLETPRRDQGYLQIATLLETGIDIKQQVELQSTIQPNYDGKYSVIGIQHRGVISEAVNGECRSVFKLLAVNQFGTFKTVQPLV